MTHTAETVTLGRTTTFAELEKQRQSVFERDLPRAHVGVISNGETITLRELTKEERKNGAFVTCKQIKKLRQVHFPNTSRTALILTLTPAGALIMKHRGRDVLVVRIRR